MNPTRLKRGFAIVAVVATIAIMNIVVFGSIGASGEHSATVALRAQSVRAFYAAESGAMVAMSAISRGDEPPNAGDRIDLGAAQVQFIEMPAGDAEGEIVVEGRSGDGRRRIALRVDVAQ